MTKRRKDTEGGKSNAFGGNSRSIYGGGTNGDDRLSVFEFNDDDMRVEDNSRKYASKFAARSPSKRPAYSMPVDKYDFLNLFARGTTNQQNNSSGNETSVFYVSDSILEDGRKDVTVSPGSLFKSLSISKYPHGIECSSSGAESRAYKSRKAGGCKSEKKHKHVLNIESDEDGIMDVLNIESDEDGIMDLQTSTSYDLEKDKGSLEEGSSRRGHDAIDCEAVVVISPMYVKIGNVYYTNCSLTFSSSYIRLEGSPHNGKTEPRHLDWSTFDIVKIEHQLSESDKADVVNLHLRSGDTDVDETCKISSGNLELEFVVIDSTQWCRKQEEIRSLNTKYESAWETIISECSFNEHFDDMVYPEGDPDSVFISRRDVELLKPMTFINDTIIDFYIKYLVNKTKPEEKRRFHFFNTFFFRKLADMDQVSSRTWDAREAFQHVRKWTRNVDLFGKDYIFIPVNFSLHWSLIVICHPGELANLRDKDLDDSSTEPCILHMDSIRGSHRGLENLIRSYLWEEWKERHDKQDADILTKFSSLNFDALQLPQQENLFDCGLFLLHYAELFLEHVANFSTTKYSDVFNEEWFLPAEVSLKKRHHIRILISRLAQDNARKDPQVACDDKYISNTVNEGDSSIEVLNRRDVKETSDENSSQLVNDDCFQQCEQQVPTSQPDGMRLTMENSLPGDIRSRSEADEDDKSTPTHFTRSSFRVVEIEVPFGISEISSGVSERIINVNNVEYPVYEVTSTPVKMKHEFVHCSVSSDDLAHCIVEDSEEEESWAESTLMTRSSILHIR